VGPVYRTTRPFHDDGLFETASTPRDEKISAKGAPKSRVRLIKMAGMPSLSIYVSYVTTRLARRTLQHLNLGNRKPKTTMASASNERTFHHEEKKLSKTVPPPEEHSISMKEERTDINSKDEDFCPLFMEGLPRDFSRNPALAALASLLDEESDDDNQKKKNFKEKEDITPQSGGGKLNSRNSRNRRRATPYPKQLGKKTKNRKTSTGEAQLFLKMWKL